jgi:hypothetical protein
MTQVIFRQTRGTSNNPAYYIIDRRVPAMQVPGFYVTGEQFATRMDRIEAGQRIAGSSELRKCIEIGLVTVEEAA